jgi:hypothetical protein
MTWRGLDRHTKYGNTPIRCHQNVMHHSKAEARRCDELHILQQAGEIGDLRAHPQPVYPLIVAGETVCKYVGDFEYTDRDGKTVTEDVKGMRTEVYGLKAKLFRALYGREISEVSAR